MNDNNSIVVITDSRGRHLESELNAEMDTPIYVEVLSGKKFQDCIPVVEDIMSNFWVDAFYIAMGINNLTYYDPISKTCTLLYETPIELAFHLVNTIRATLTELKGLYPDIPVIVNSLYGMNLAVYHNRGYYSQTEQQTLDTAIDLINTEIIQINHENGVLTPHTSNVIHRYNRTKKANDSLYHRLYDGLHPSYSTQAHIARVLARTMHSNIMANYDTHSLYY